MFFVNNFYKNFQSLSSKYTKQFNYKTEEINKFTDKNVLIITLSKGNSE